MTKWFLIALTVGSLALTMDVFAGAGCGGCKGKKDAKQAEECQKGEKPEKPAEGAKA
jgi:hypothetical protein